MDVLTTLVNIVAYNLLSKLCHLEENVSQWIAIFLSVIFAFFTNRKWVFQSGAKTSKEKFAEFYKFMFARGVSMLIQAGGFFLLFNIMHVNDSISNILMNGIIIIINYFFSKFFAFKKKKPTVQENDNK